MLLYDKSKWMRCLDVSDGIWLYKSSISLWDKMRDSVSVGSECGTKVRLEDEQLIILKNSWVSSNSRRGWWLTMPLLSPLIPAVGDDDVMDDVDSVVVDLQPGKSASLSQDEHDDNDGCDATTDADDVVSSKEVAAVVLTIFVQELLLDSTGLLFCVVDCSFSDVVLDVFLTSVAVINDDEEEGGETTTAEEAVVVPVKDERLECSSKLLLLPVLLVLLSLNLLVFSFSLSWPRRLELESPETDDDDDEFAEEDKAFLGKLDDVALLALKSGRFTSSSVKESLTYDFSREWCVSGRLDRECWSRLELLFPEELVEK